MTDARKVAEALAKIAQITGEPDLAYEIERAMIDYGNARVQEYAAQFTEKLDRIEAKLDAQIANANAQQS
jgi:hypothetical protein